MHSMWRAVVLGVVVTLGVVSNSNFGDYDVSSLGAA
jgi:hypothetical protein